MVFHGQGYGWPKKTPGPPVQNTTNIYLEGRPGGWAEVYRVFRKCKFVENEGNILFYKNAKGLAAS